MTLIIKNTGTNVPYVDHGTQTPFIPSHTTRSIEYESRQTEAPMKLFLPAARRHRRRSESMGQGWSASRFETQGLPSHSHIIVNPTKTGPQNWLRSTTRQRRILWQQKREMAPFQYGLLKIPVAWDSLENFKLDLAMSSFYNINIYVFVCIWGVPGMGVPQNGWFTRENLMKYG